jgi:hypothetical protein
MSTGYFAVLNDSSSDEEDTAPERLQQTPQRQNRERSTRSKSIREEASEAGQVQIPSYEDLSTTRTDEVTVLQAVYGQEFQQNGPFEFLVNVRPPDIEAERIGSHLT